MIYINGKSERDYNANYIHFEVSPPEPKKELIEIPLRDGYIDGTALLSDHIFYAQRTVTIGLELRSLRYEWPWYYSKLLGEIHGRTVKVIRTEDANWYWTGIASVGALEDHGASAGVTITVTAQPFKRRTEKERVFADSVSGDTTITITSGWQRAYLYFNTSATGFTVSIDGETWTLPQGEGTAYGLFLPYGESTLAVHGSGTLDIDMEGGAL